MDAEAIACDVETGRDREKLALRRRGKDDASTGEEGQKNAGQTAIETEEKSWAPALGKL